MNMRAVWLGFCALTFVVGLPAAARAQLPVKTTEQPPVFNASGSGPDTKGIPFFDQIRTNGGSLHYLGERSGLYGWLIIQNGMIQMVYMPADRKTVIIGAMFADDGALVTSHQINALTAKDKQVAEVMSGNAAQQMQITRANTTDGGYAILDANQKPLGPPTAIPALPVTPGERLLMDLQAAAGVVVGPNASAPELTMVISANCSYCKRAWEELRDEVKAGRIRIRLVPISRDSVSDETAKAAVLLRVADPYETWDRYVRGDANALSTEPDPVAVRAIFANREITDRWNILGTPYLIYRGQGGKIKIVQGKPERMASVLADMIRDDRK